MRAAGWPTPRSESCQSHSPLVERLVTERLRRYPQGALHVRVQVESLGPSYGLTRMGSFEERGRHLVVGDAAVDAAGVSVRDSGDLRAFGVSAL